MQKGLLLGDNGFPCKRYLLTPVEHPASRAEQLYNRVHIKCPISIERTIFIIELLKPVVVYLFIPLKIILYLFIFSEDNCVTHSPYKFSKIQCFFFCMCCFVTYIPPCQNLANFCYTIKSNTTVYFVISS